MSGQIRYHDKGVCGYENMDHGEPICEIMRRTKKMGLKEAGTFLGPYKPGAPAIFIDTAAKLKHPCGFIGTIGEDDFGLCVKEKLEKDGVNCTYLSVDREVSTGVAFVAYDNEDERTFIYHVGNAAAGRIVYPKRCRRISVSSMLWDVP